MALVKTAGGSKQVREEPVSFAGPVPGKVVYVVEPNTFVPEGHILVKVKFQENLNGRRARDNIRAPFAGKVLKVNCKINTVLKAGDVAFLMSRECPHTTLLKGLCAICGVDVYRSMERQSNATRHDPGNQKRKPFADTWRDTMRERLPVIHHVPELSVSQEYANELGKQDQTRLLDERRLVLLVDLDETIIHTTDFRVDHAALDPTKRDEVTTFGIHGKIYHTKLRPHCRQFLAKIQSLYELHICTFGYREYAHKIASFIDPEGKLFSHRILSRNELLDPKSKTANLKALFPCGDEMTCIIDDRPDIWDHAPNLIHVEPYIYFQNQGDINAPPHLTEHENAAVSGSKTASASVAASGPADTSYQQSGSSSANGVASSGFARSVATFAVIPSTEHDNYLLLLEELLKKLHAYWYKQYDLLKLSVPALPAESPVKKLKKSSRSRKSAREGAVQQPVVPPSRLPSLKSIMPAIRKTILRGCRVYISDEITRQQRMQQQRYMHRLRYDECATMLGARIVHDSTNLSGVTHIVSEQRPDFDAALASPASSLGLWYVTPHWLIRSLFSWKRQDENRFVPTQVSQQTSIRDAETSSLCNFETVLTPATTELAAAGKPSTNAGSSSPTSKRKADQALLGTLKSLQNEIDADEFAEDDDVDSSSDVVDAVDAAEKPMDLDSNLRDNAARMVLPAARGHAVPATNPDVSRQREGVTRLLAQLQQRRVSRPSVAPLRVSSGIASINGRTGPLLATGHVLKLHVSSDIGLLPSCGSRITDSVDAGLEGITPNATKMPDADSDADPINSAEDVADEETDYDAAGIIGSDSSEVDDDSDVKRLEEKWSGVCLDDQ